MPSTNGDSKSVADRYYDEVVKTIDVEKYTRFATYLDDLSKEGRINDMRRELAVFVYDLITQKQKEAEEIHDEIYTWLLGLGGDFPQSEPGKRYNWRSQLREKIPKDMLYSINRKSPSPDREEDKR